MARQQRGYLVVSLACIACLTVTTETFLGITLRLPVLGILAYALYKFATTDR
jgi:hypothetical protein